MIYLGENNEKKSKKDEQGRREVDAEIKNSIFLNFVERICMALFVFAPKASKAVTVLKQSSSVASQQLRFILQPGGLLIGLSIGLHCTTLGPRRDNIQSRLLP
jgi:hypothetical protein